MLNQGIADNDNVYFIRHKEFEGDRQNILDIMKQKKIAIRFDNKPWNVVFDANAGQYSPPILGNLPRIKVLIAMRISMV